MTEGVRVWIITMHTDATQSLQGEKEHETATQLLLLPLTRHEASRYILDVTGDQAGDTVVILEAGDLTCIALQVWGTNLQPVAPTDQGQPRCNGRVLWRFSK